MPSKKCIIRMGIEVSEFTSHGKLFLNQRRAVCQNWNTSLGMSTDSGPASRKGSWTHSMIWMQTVSACRKPSCSRIRSNLTCPDTTSTGTALSKRLQRDRDFQQERAFVRHLWTEDRGTWSGRASHHCRFRIALSPLLLHAKQPARTCPSGLPHEMGNGNDCLHEASFRRKARHPLRRPQCRSWGNRYRQPGIQPQERRIHRRRKKPHDWASVRRIYRFLPLQVSWQGKGVFLVELFC